MIPKLYSRLLIMICLVASIPAHSQNKQTHWNYQQVSDRYGEYLRAVGLSSTLRITKIVYTDTVSVSDKKLHNRYLLELAPAAKFTGPLDFNDHWLQVLKLTRNKINLYEELFLKFCSLSGIPPDSAAIRIDTKRPDIFSVLVYFDKRMVITGNTAKPKSYPPVLSGAEAIDLDNGLLGMVFRKVPVKTNPRDALIRLITDFLKGGHHPVQNGRVVVMPPKQWGESLVNLTATGIVGRVTGKYNELITVDLIVIMSADRKSADIALSFNVYFASGPIDPQHTENYENALRSYKSGMVTFSTDLKKLLNNALYDRKI